MNKFQKLWTAAKAQAPALGILAFSLASVNSVANLFLSRALHPTPILWLSAALVEVCTAWLVFQVVETGRKLTKSRISQQDKRFYRGIFVAFGLLALPSLGLSVAANVTEFGSLALGAIFPSLSLACAVGVALPSTVGRYERAKETEAATAANTRKANRKAKDIERQRLELDRKAEETKAELDRKQAETQAEILSGLGAAGRTLALYESRPGIKQAEAASELGVSTRTVRNHLDRLADLGAMKKNGRGWEVT